MFDGISYCGILSVIVYKKLHPTAIRHSSGLQVLYHCFSGAAGIEAGYSSHLSSGAGAHLSAPFLLYRNYNTE